MLRLFACLVALSIVLLGQGYTSTAGLAYWSADELKAGDARLLLSTQTHLMKVVRVTGSSLAESHEGTSDVFFVESGSGSIIVGGEIADAKPLADMPGEVRGRTIQGGRRYELQPGAMINIPPSTPYLLQGPPWTLIEK